MSSMFTSELKEGMVTLTDTYSTKGQLVLPKNTIITKNIINKLISNSVLFVEISDEPVEPTKSLDFISDFTVDTEAITKTKEYKVFKRRYDRNIEIMSEHFNDIVHKHAPAEVDTMLSNALNIIESTDSPLSIFTMLSTLKNYDDSTFNHSLNVALICNIFGTWLNLPRDMIELITACGLFHDVGKLLIPDEIIKKPGKLTPEEYSIIKTHTQLGYDLLKKRKADIHIQYAALMHHEKFDGTGYPLALPGDQIDWCAQIVTIADIYEAMTAKRVYRDAISPFTVISTFEDDGLKKYNPKYLLTFLERVVNSYMNCKVKLSNGDEGDIVYINRVSLSKPMIKTGSTFLDLSKQPHISIESIL
ncbi:MAG: HD-GYP domain-containing protein [Lachnospiraceae bacterium]|nr:HD-GYP domain-containing protein [Lachnospiraceae bacterium]